MALKVSDIDSERMLLRIEQGKGRKDRFAMLSRLLLELLRDWYRIARPTVWLFPGRDPLLPLTTRQFNRVVHAAADRAGIKKRVSPHTLRHSFTTLLLEEKTDVRSALFLLSLVAVYLMLRGTRRQHIPRVVRPFGRRIFSTPRVDGGISDAEISAAVAAFFDHLLGGALARKIIWATLSVSKR